MKYLVLFSWGKKNSMSSTAIVNDTLRVSFLKIYNEHNITSVIYRSVLLPGEKNIKSYV